RSDVDRMAGASSIAELGGREVCNVVLAAGADLASRGWARRAGPVKITAAENVVAARGDDLEAVRLDELVASQLVRQYGHELFRIFRRGGYLVRIVVARLARGEVQVRQFAVVIDEGREIVRPLGQRLEFLLV